MKLLILLSTLFCLACSHQVPSENLSGQNFVKPGEAVTTTARSFDYMPSPAILIFSETRDWRHEEGIAGATLAIIKVAKEIGYGYFTTEHSGVFNDKDLKRFDVVVFNNMTGDALTKNEKAAFARWQSRGNGSVLIHGSGDDSSKGWRFYHDVLLGAKFVSHPMAPQFQQARIQVLEQTHPVMAGVPFEFTAVDEWYTFEAPPGKDFILLAGIDESTYSPLNLVYGDRSDLRMGPKPIDHPIIWARCHGPNNARSVFTAMGHLYETYETVEGLLILKNALNWVAKKNDAQSDGCI